MDVRARLTELARIRGAATPVVSVYLNTRWSDEQQRERVRVFLKNELRRARSRAGADRELRADLDWIQSQGELLIEQVRFPEAHGAALFACGRLGLREILPARVPFENTFVVADAPFLRPLAESLEKIPSALVVFVDGESARLIPLDPAGAGEELRLESDVPGHHRRGGWAQLAQSRYQRHIQDHRGRHLEAVAEALVNLADGNGVARVVLAGEARNVAALEKHLPQRISERIAGRIPGVRHEPAGALLRRAAGYLGHMEAMDVGGVDAVLTDAAKGGKAVAGLEETLEAVSRGAVHRLYLLKGFSQPGRVCLGCGALQGSAAGPCRLCGAATEATELGAAMVERVLASGGLVKTLLAHPTLAQVGGVAALLRYPL